MEMPWYWETTEVERNPDKPLSVTFKGRVRWWAYPILYIHAMILWLMLDEDDLFW